MQMGQYQLTGTIQVENKLYAFLKEVKTGRGLRAAQGDTLSTGLKLAKVDVDRVVFTQFDSEEEVKMQVAKSTRLTPVAPPPGAPGAPGTPGAPGAPGAPVPPGTVAGAPTPAGAPQPGQLPAPRPVDSGTPATPGPARPGAPQSAGSPTISPFVPGVSSAPSGGPEAPPRRRGATQ